MARRLRSVPLIMVVIALSGCSAHNPFIVINTTDTVPVSEVKYPPHTDNIFITSETIIAYKYDLIGFIRFKESLRYILVQAFQDINYAQFEVVKLLAGDDRNITVVGDDDQSIYKFRGAAISNILGFVDCYPDARQIVLTTNYRSAQAILDCAYRLVRFNNPDRLEVRNAVDKRLVAVKGEGAPPGHLHFDSVSAEADAVASLMRRRSGRGLTATRTSRFSFARTTTQTRYLRALNIFGSGLGRGLARHEDPPPIPNASRQLRRLFKLRAKFARVRSPPAKPPPGKGSRTATSLGAPCDRRREPARMADKLRISRSLWRAGPLPSL